jgi:hypothetical protein
MGVLDLDFVLKQILPSISDMVALKHPFSKRLRGNRLVTSLAKKLGENGMDKEPMIMKLVKGICHDTNYKIRMDGVLFFRDYLKD